MTQRIGKATELMNSVRSMEDEHRPAYETIAAKITALITDSGLKPGDRLPTEHELSEQLGASRTVIREAVKVLVTIGLVYTRRGSGLYVANGITAKLTPPVSSFITIDPAQVSSLYEYRLILELPAARLAAEHITPHELQELRKAVAFNQHCAEVQDRQRFGESDADIHRAIAEATHNPFLIAAIVNMRHTQNWVFEIAAGRTQDVLQIYVEQHLAILAAIQEGEPDAAEQAMHVHLLQALLHSRQEVLRRVSGGKE